jgi:hypothetical protein
MEVNNDRKKMKFFRVNIDLEHFAPMTVLIVAQGGRKYLSALFSIDGRKIIRTVWILLSEI